MIVQANPTFRNDIIKYHALFLRIPPVRTCTIFIQMLQEPNFTHLHTSQNTLLIFYEIALFQQSVDIRSLIILVILIFHLYSVLQKFIIISEMSIFARLYKEKHTLATKEKINQIPNVGIVPIQYAIAM